MKINRFIALAAVALLVVGAMGAMATRSFALGTQTAAGTQAPASIVTQSPACAQDQADGTEVKSSADTDNVDLQCGDQTTLDSSSTVAETVGSAEAPAGVESASAETAGEAQPSDGPNGPSVQIDQSGQSDGQFGQ